MQVGNKCLSWPVAPQYGNSEFFQIRTARTCSPDRSPDLLYKVALRDWQTYRIRRRNGDFPGLIRWQGARCISPVVPSFPDAGHFR